MLISDPILDIAIISVNCSISDASNGATMNRIKVKNQIHTFLHYIKFYTMYRHFYIEGK